MTSIVTSKMTSVRSGTLLLLFCGLSVGFAHAAPQRPPHPSSGLFPKACYFFEPAPRNHPDLSNEQKSPKVLAYEATFLNVYRLWCTATESTPEIKEKAADAMVSAWKLAWEEDEPYNAEFHETTGFDLLALLGITHYLPVPMVTDSKLTQMWVEECSQRCFTIWGVPEDAAGEHEVAMTLWLRNDVLDNLKKEPASEPVVKMLDDATFRLVD